MRFIISAKNPVCTFVVHARKRRDAVILARCMRRVRGADVRVIKLRVLRGGMRAAVAPTKATF